MLMETLNSPRERERNRNRNGNRNRKEKQGDMLDVVNDIGNHEKPCLYHHCYI